MRSGPAEQSAQWPPGKSGIVRSALKYLTRGQWRLVKSSRPKSLKPESNQSSTPSFQRGQ